MLGRISNTLPDNRRFSPRRGRAAAGACSTLPRWPQQRKEFMGGIVRPWAPLWRVAGHRMAEVHSRRIVDVGPVGDNASRREFPSAVALFIFVEIASAYHDLGFTALRGERVGRNAVDLTFRDLATDGEVRRGDVMLHRPDVGPRFSQRAQKRIDRAR